MTATTVYTANRTDPPIPGSHLFGGGFASEDGFRGESFWDRIIPTLPNPVQGASEFLPRWFGRTVGCSFGPCGDGGGITTADRVRNSPDFQAGLAAGASAVLVGSEIYVPGGSASVECATSHHRCGEAGVWITAEIAIGATASELARRGGAWARTRAVGSVTPAPRALPAARQVDATWGPAHQYAQGPGPMTAIEHINYRHAFDSGLDNVSRFADGTSVGQIQGYVDDALRYGDVSQGGASIRFDVGQVIGTDQAGNAVSGIQVWVRDGYIRTAYPVAP